MQHLLLSLRAPHLAHEAGCGRVFGGICVVTEAAFRHLTALRALDCADDPAVTDAVLRQLPCLRELRLYAYSHEAITDAACRPLSLLEVLDISYCRYSTITDAAFAPPFAAHA